MNNLTNLIEKMMPNIVAALKRILKKYTNTSGEAIIKLSNEFLFYLSFIELEKKLTEHGLSCCIGTLSDQATVFDDFYNIRLAIYHMNKGIEDEVVCNNIEFSKNNKVLILTGANRGGKTVFTQGIGLLMLLFKQGVFVPCSSCKIQICDGIYTHFPADENQTIALGRLGEEADRLNSICKKATSDSLLLFNESFATTSHTESLYIATDVIKYLCCLGARVCFNTHMHELAENADKISTANKSVCNAVSIVMGNADNNRSYKVYYEKPVGESYAHDIAYKFGITFEQLYYNLK